MAMTFSEDDDKFIVIPPTIWAMLSPPDPYERARLDFNARQRRNLGLPEPMPVTEGTTER